GSRFLRQWRGSRAYWLASQFARDCLKTLFPARPREGHLATLASRGPRCGDPVLALDSRHQRVYARLRRAMRGNERSFAAAFGLAKTRYSAIWIGPAPSSTLRPSRGVARNDAGEKASSIHRKAWGVDRPAATASRRSQAQGREGQS